MSDRPDVQGVYDDLGEWDPTWRADGTGHLIAQASEVIGWLVDRLNSLPRFGIEIAAVTQLDGDDITRVLIRDLSSGEAADLPPVEARLLLDFLDNPDRMELSRLR